MTAVATIMASLVYVKIEKSMPASCCEKFTANVLYVTSDCDSVKTLLKSYTVLLERGFNGISPSLKGFKCAL